MIAIDRPVIHVEIERPIIDKFVTANVLAPKAGRGKSGARCA